MTVPNDVSLNDEWDPFSQQVQEKLIEELELEDAEISVDRHDGKNETVIVELKLKTKRNAKKNQSIHDEGNPPRRQLSEKQLDRIQSILDELLQNCTMKFGDIKFVVNQGLLEKTVFSYSTRPNESCDLHVGKA